jgi:hypothetical protein
MAFAQPAWLCPRACAANEVMDSGIKIQPQQVVETIAGRTTAFDTATAVLFRVVMWIAFAFRRNILPDRDFMYEFLYGSDFSNREGKPVSRPPSWVRSSVSWICLSWFSSLL